MSPDTWTFSNIIQTTLAISFGMWAWLLKKFGEEHITGIKEMSNEMRELRKEFMTISERIQRVEIKQEWMFKHKDD